MLLTLKSFFIQRYKILFLLHIHPALHPTRHIDLLEQLVQQHVAGWVDGWVDMQQK